MAQYVVLRESELGNKDYDYFEKILFFDNEEEAKAEAQKWYDFLNGYPCNGSATIAKIGY